jgi:hypothetical protein
VEGVIPVDRQAALLVVLVILAVVVLAAGVAQILLEDLG